MAPVTKQRGNNPQVSPRQKRGPWRSARWMASFGVGAAAVLLICLNVLSSRFFKRWDVTSSGLYTLSPITLSTLARLEEPVEVVVFLSRQDPLSQSVGYLLDAYRAQTRLLEPRFVDPDRNPAEFIALQQRYGLFDGKTESGRLATEASIVLSAGDRRWFVTTDDVLVFDDEGQAKPRLEQALTEGLVNLLGRERFNVCFTQGHQEPSLDAGGPQSLSELRLAIERSNHAVRAVDLASPDPKESLLDCRLVIVAAPAVPFSLPAARRLAQHVERGGSLLALVGPIADDEGRLLDPGLSPVLGAFGIDFRQNLVFERDPALFLPVGIGGEALLATPKPHEVTAGLVTGGKVRTRVLMQLAQGLSLDPLGTALPLLASSPRSLSVTSFRQLELGKLNVANVPDQAEVLAAAAERAVQIADQRNVAAQTDVTAANQPKNNPKARVLVVGSPSIAWPSTFRDPALLGTRRFLENAVSWLVAAPLLVSVPEKQSFAAGLHLTEETLGEVQRYVLIYVPLCAALIGAVIVLRRRRDWPQDSPQGGTQ